MQLIKIIQAQAALHRLTKTRFKNFAVARNLCVLQKRVDEESDFFYNEQKKAIMAYAELKDEKPVFADGKHIQLKDEESKIAFDAEMQRLYHLEISDISPVEVSEADFCSSEDYPTPVDMMDLDSLVAFKEG